MCQSFRPASRTGYVPTQRAGERMALVEVAVAIVRLQVVAVERNDPAVCGNLVQIMCPGITKLRTQSMPGARTQRSLQSGVVGRADAVELVNGTEVGIRAEEWINEGAWHSTRNFLIDVP